MYVNLELVFYLKINHFLPNPTMPVIKLNLDLLSNFNYEYDF